MNYPTNLKLFVLSLVLSLSEVGYGCEHPEIITPSEALLVKDLSKKVTVEGLLINAGSNYFTDRKIAITNEDGTSQLLVQEWLPISFALSNDDSNQPDTMSVYLDKNVVLTGRIEILPVKGIGITKLFIVDNARVKQDSD